jgi:lysophospholipase L1-like esterase
MDTYISIGGGANPGTPARRADPGRAGGRGRSRAATAGGWLLAALAIAAGSGALGMAAADALAVAPDDGRIHYEGRLDWLDPLAPTMSFPGCAVVVRFQGPGLEARLSTTIADHVQVVIDGRPAAVVAVTRTPADYGLARDLPKGEHTLEMYKATETNRGTLQFYGLRLQPGTVLLPVPKAARTIEFVGDSITCGYGDMAANLSEPVSPENSNWYYTFGSITARRFGADEVTVAASGIRLTQEGDWPAMPTVYRRVHTYDGGIPWDFTQGPVPDVVVVDLGTNDFRTKGPDEETWVRTYLEFIDYVRARRPLAQIYIVDGPMMPPGPDLDHLRSWNKEVVARRAAAGDARCRAFSFDVQRKEDGYGSDWHPNVTTNAKMADQLVAVIKSDTSW